MSWLGHDADRRQLQRELAGDEGKELLHGLRAECQSIKAKSWQELEAEFETLGARRADSDGVIGDATKILTLWLNATMSLTVAWSQREDTEGAWVGLKKPTWLAMPVLDPRALSPEARATMVAAFDKLRAKQWAHWPDLEKDDVRVAADAAVSEALKLPDLAWLRAMLAREPILTDRPLT